MIIKNNKSKMKNYRNEASDELQAEAEHYGAGWNGYGETAD